MLRLAWAHEASVNLQPLAITCQSVAIIYLSKQPIEFNNYVKKLITALIGYVYGGGGGLECIVLVAGEVIFTANHNQIKQYANLAFL